MRWGVCSICFDGFRSSRDAPVRVSAHVQVMNPHVQQGVARVPVADDGTMPHHPRGVVTVDAIGTCSYSLIGQIVSFQFRVDVDELVEFHLQVFSDDLSEEPLR